MKKTLSLLFVVFFVTVCFGSALAYEAIVGPTGVLKYDREKSYGGYTLFAPMIGCKTTYLIDMEGNLIHKWESEYPPGFYAMLLPNGNLLRGGNMAQKGDNKCNIGGAAGTVQEIDWDGNVVWEYKMNTPTEVQHHCFDRMPNGNTLMLGWEKKTRDEWIAKGRNPESIPTSCFYHGFRFMDLWVDFVREVDKNGKTVWEWHVWDHIGQGPHQFNVNYQLPKGVGDYEWNYDWTHFNTCEYIPENDWLLLNSRNFSEFYIIDHKTGQMLYR